MAIKCLDEEPKRYKAHYIIGGVERVYHLCAKHTELEVFKQGLVKLEPISYQMSEALQDA